MTNWLSLLSIGPGPTESMIRQAHNKPRGAAGTSTSTGRVSSQLAWVEYDPQEAAAQIRSSWCQSGKRSSSGGPLPLFAWV